MPSSAALLVSALALLSQAQAFFILDHAPLVRTRLDPIVNPGTISSHVHNVVGGSRFGKDYSHDDLSKSRCTTAAVSVDKSNYWAPQLYYYDPAKQTYRAMGSYARTYYLQRPGNKNEKINAFPKGLRMLAGNPNRRTYDASSFADQAISFVCLDYYNSHAGDPAWEQRSDFFQHNCPDGMRAQIFFPSCWDGVNLDSPDHKSHMAYPVDTFQGGNCPASHPVHLVSLFYEFIFFTGDYPFNAAGTPTWVFANGDTTGLSFHADFTNGWDTDVLQSALDTCGLETGGNIDACPALKPFIDYGAASACQIENQIVNEDVGFQAPIGSLPGNNPLWSTTTPKPSIPGYNETAGYAGAGSTLPTGWSTVGCVSQAAGKVLTAIGYSSDSMTLATCAAYCGALSLPFSGVEFGRECSCDSRLRNGGSLDKLAPSSECSVRCTGLSTENCGGANRITISVNPTFAPTQPILPDGWVYSSCMTEPPSGRALGAASTASSTMTVETCVNFCSNKGFAYAGLEWSSECWCSNTVAAGAVTAPEEQCSNTCSGNIRQACGGSSRLSVYYSPKRLASAASSSLVAARSSVTDAIPSSIPTSASSSRALTISVPALFSSLFASSSAAAVVPTPSTSISAARVASISSIAAVNSVLAVIPAPPASTKVSSSSSSSSTRATTTTSSSAAATSSAVAAVVKLAPGYEIFSSPCLAQTNPKLLTIKAVSNSTMTPSLCTAHCAQSGLAYSGIEYGGECACSATKPAGNPSTACTMACNGDKTLRGCGGPSAVSVYYSSAVDAAAKLVLPTGWAVNTDGPGACVGEVPGARTLVGFTTDSSSMTIPTCLTTCQSRGYKYAGLEYSSQCWCSNTIDARAVASKACTMACSGASWTTCGGSSALSIYKLSA